jgi:glutathione synthase/RimK-type ligase-like ATP-grasp enzyme
VPDADLVFVTASRMPKPDSESDLVVRALAQRGLTATIHPWDQPYDWDAFGLVVCRTPWDYFHRLDEFLGWARSVAARTALVNPIQTIAWNAHKSYLLDLERAGIPIVPTVLVGRDSGTGEQARALSRFGHSVIKPAVAGGALGALRVDTTADATVAADHLRGLLADRDALIQPFIDGVQSEGETSLIFFDGVLSHSVRKVPATGDFRVHEIHGGSVVGHDPTAAELEVAHGALAAAPTPTVYARIDLVPGPGGPAVMEAELIEPELFLPRSPGAAGRFAAALAARLPRAGVDSYPS